MTFSEQEKKIYDCPHTGKQYDPLAVKRALIVATKGKFGLLCKEAADANEAVSAKAQQLLTDAARCAFGLKPGLDPLDAVVYSALCDFTRWLVGKGPRAQSRPASVPSTATPGQSTTKPSSG